MNSTIYKRMVGSLMYLTATRPGLMYDVSLISKFMESPKYSLESWKTNSEICCRYSWIWNLVHSFTGQYSHGVH